MEKQELFKKGMEAINIEVENREVLYSVGMSIGSNAVVFKELYRSYLTKEQRYEYQPFIGAKMEVVFNVSEDEIMIKQLGKALEFTSQTFLQYMNVIKLCFSEIYPIGSVVELDAELLRPEFLKLVNGLEENEGVQVVITGRFVPLDEEEAYVVEYLARLWPYGEGSASDPILLSKEMIKRVVHSGLTDELEESVVAELREELIMSNKKVLSCLPDEELDVLLEDSSIEELEEAYELEKEVDIGGVQ
jgi:hypothetical protein